MLADVIGQCVDGRQHLVCLLLVSIGGKMVHHQAFEVLKGFFHTGMVLVRNASFRASSKREYKFLLVCEMFLEFLFEIGKELPDNPLCVIRARNDHPAKA